MTTPHGSAQPQRDSPGGFNGAQSFTRSAERVVSYLNAHTPLSDWSVSRLAGGEQVHVHVHHDQVLSTGDRVAWEESLCSRMAAGAAHVVRNSRADEDYANLEAVQHVGAYAGYSIYDDHGDMFGVLCGVRPTPLADDEVIDEELVRLLSELLSSQLELARGVDRQRRRVELAEGLAHTDSLTGLLNRRGWDRVLVDAQERIDAFGDPVAVGIIDLNGLKGVNDLQGHEAGDALIVRAAQVLTGAATASHRIARVGGDEFTVLSNGVVSADAAEHFATFVGALAAAGVDASIGWAAAVPGVATVTEALAVADQQMYAQKNGIFSAR